MSVSLPFFSLSLQERHVFPLSSQLALLQSASTRHAFLSAQGPHHSPPQSIEVSAPSLQPLAQEVQRPSFAMGSSW
jgi:hypothetical protein